MIFQVQPQGKCLKNSEKNSVFLRQLWGCANTLQNRDTTSVLSRIQQPCRDPAGQEHRSSHTRMLRLVVGNISSGFLMRSKDLGIWESHLTHYPMAIRSLLWEGRCFFLSSLIQGAGLNKLKKIPLAFDLLIKVLSQAGWRWTAEFWTIADWAYLGMFSFISSSSVSGNQHMCFHHLPGPKGLVGSLLSSSSAKWTASHSPLTPGANKQCFESFLGLGCKYN